MVAIKSSLQKSTINFPGGGEEPFWANAYEGESKSWIETFYCFGNSEENDKVVAKIKEYKARQDYKLSQNQTSEWTPGLLNKYEILNSQLKQELGEICKKYSSAIKSETEKRVEEAESRIRETEKIRKETEERVKRHQQYIDNIDKNSHRDKKPTKIYSEKSEVNSTLPEIKKEWNWREFWVGTGVAIFLFGLALIIMRLFKKSKKEV